jgi:hypothetical protein
MLSFFDVFSKYNFTLKDKLDNVTDFNQQCRCSMYDLFYLFQ